MKKKRVKLLMMGAALSVMATVPTLAASNSGSLSIPGGTMACHANLVCADRSATATTRAVPNESSRCFVSIIGVSQANGKNYQKTGSKDNYSGSDVSVSVAPDAYPFDHATSTHIVSYGSSSWSTSLIQNVVH